MGVNQMDYPRPNSNKNQRNQLFLAAAKKNKIGNVGHRQRFKSSAAQRLWSNIFSANGVYN